jgi:hypothetical protein
MFANRGLRRIFGHRREQVRGGWRDPLKQDVRDL